MKKSMLSLLAFLTLAAALPAQARTVAFFPVIGGGRAIFTIQNPTLGPPDNDAQALYEAMNVTPEQSFIGPGKGIATADQAFNLVCGIRSGSIYTCSLVIQDSNHSGVDGSTQKAWFVLKGEQAKAMTELFIKGEDGHFIFKTSDGQFALEGTDEEFRFTFEK